MWRDNLLQALANLVTNRGRTALSLLGIVIGVAAVVLVVNLTESGINKATEGFQEFGLDTLTVFPGWNAPKGAKVLGLTNGTATELRQTLPWTVSVSGVINSQGFGWGSSAEVPVSVQAVQSDYFTAYRLPLDFGRVFTVADEIRRDAVAVVGSALVKDLFPEGKPLDQYISLSLGNKVSRFRVIGVLATKDSQFGSDVNRSILVPLGTWQMRQTGSTAVDNLVVRVSTTEHALDVQQAIVAWSLQKTGYPSAVYVQSPQEWLSQVNDQKQTLTLIFSGVAGISLLVGGIGIMNIMLVSVTERRREIGIRKAIGARPRDIRRQFLLEACLLTGTGGLMGLTAGIGISWSVTAILGWTFSTSVVACIVALGSSAAMGIFFGYSPAARASRLDPIAALSEE